ncbi:unnamed protein product [Paramecium sonneborni]|uniref:B30.2/SPRY domain-containing protein n=1 Tax=Paramecium sonneborni TaxID=65129 RepID=A0A8S1NKE6_9CILI|nr:unnamed protein product [Paramecium sonneborni]
MGDDYGFDKVRFTNYKEDIFDCPICSCVARLPKDCSCCGTVFCGPCVDSWLKKQSECINRCPKNSTIQNIQKSLKKIYDDLEIRCSYCPKSFKIAEIEKHEINCKLPKCVNYEVCGNIVGSTYEFENFKVCDHTCMLMSKIKQTKNKLDLYACLKQYVKDRQIGQQVQTNQLGLNSDQVNPNIPVFKWDRQRMGTGIVSSDGDTRIFLKEQAYMFRTAVATYGFEKGIGYWEIEADDKTENELKIGVSTCRDFNYNTAFCDFEFGWAYYGLAQLRHNSNATGPSFGKRFKKEGILGVCLNMNTGTLKFSLNGELMGTAYTDEKLKQGPIYPAVSLLHCAGCKIITGKPIPAIFLN